MSAGRKVRVWIVVLALLLVLVLVTAGHSESAKKSTPTGPSRPNIVFLLTDDLDVPEMAYMPHVKQLLADQGVTFNRFYVSVSLCCPSRTSILRGQYSHNTGVLSNGSGNGGFETAYRLGIERSTVGTWLQKAGYRTAYIGKYLNAYPDTVSDTYVPPGWNEFDSAVAGDPYTEYNYTLNENHHLHRYGGAPSDYGTTVYVNKAERFIRSDEAQTVLRVPERLRATRAGNARPAGPEPVPGRESAPHPRVRPARRDRQAPLAPRPQAAALPGAVDHGRALPAAHPVAPGRRPWRRQPSSTR